LKWDLASREGFKKWALIHDGEMPPKKKQFYAREESGMARNLPYRFGQTYTTRASLPLLGWTAQPEIIRKKQPVTVGASNLLERTAILCGRNFGDANKHPRKNPAMSSPSRSILPNQRATSLSGSPCKSLTE
jgi:hypothetical protein